MFSSVSSSGLFSRRPLPLNPGPTDLWDWLRRRLWRLWCLSQSIKGPSYCHFQRSHCWLLIIFFSSLCRVRQVVQATDLRTCWRWELESLKALWPSSTTRWTFSSPSSQTRWWFTQYTNNGDEHIGDSEYGDTYHIELIDTQNSWTDTDDAEMMIVHSNQHKQSTQSTHLGLLVEDQETKNGLSLSARYPSETIFSPKSFLSSSVV